MGLALRPFPTGTSAPRCKRGLDVSPTPTTSPGTSAGDADKFPRFWLYDWQDGAFWLSRPPTEIPS